MDIMQTSERLMGMKDEVWARHANPWSVWTRFTCLPLLVLAIWSRAWLGYWALLPIAASLLWIWWNPRAFSPAKTWDSWASQGTLGERVLLRRKELISAHHLIVTNWLAFGSAIGVLPMAYGLWQLDVSWTLLGLVLIILPKVWFVDRMVWIWRDFLQSGGSIDDLKVQS